MKKFVFLYPIKEYIDFEIKNSFRRIENLPEVYKKNLNKCIDLRYRKKDFGINYVVFKNSLVSEIIDLREDDKIISAEIDYKTHKKWIYPNPDFVIDKLGKPEELIVSGFHMWDCVEKFAKRAFERGIKTLVDEDLTEFFVSRIAREDFKFEEYPNFNPRNKEKFFFESFMEARKGKPWLWHKY